VKVGLEVHQQLATGKLFCGCPPELSDEVRGTLVRRLRPAGGKEHEVDRAAEFQASRALQYRYEIAPSSCLVELDEEPPHALDPEALDVALTVALLVGARTVDEVEVMRKIVVDGSNTSGFQRTALVAVGGSLEVGGRRHSILSICLEEDSARKVREGTGEVVYRLDRLGIPLIEMATGPDITSGAEARAVAEEIGALLRATRRVRRGIGTIREDLNVSAEGGHRIEVKGVQELRRIREYVEREEARQKALLSVTAELKRRSARVDATPLDLTKELQDAAPGVVASQLRMGGVALGLALRGFAGLLGPIAGSDERLGRELADQARADGLGGAIHSDELPGHGLASEHAERVRRALSLQPDDGFVFVVDRGRDRAERAIRHIAQRAEAARIGIPGETRDPLPDGRTRYSRPLPGRDRMYPETDIPPIPIEEARLARLRAALPELPALTVARLQRERGLAAESAHQLVYGGSAEAFEELAARGRAPALVARLLTHDLPGLPSEPARPPFEPPVELLDALLRSVEAGRFAKEGLPAVLRALADGAPDVDAGIRKAGLDAMSPEELARLAGEVVAKNVDLLRKEGDRAFSPLMGDLMRDVRGRRDGREVAEALRRAMEGARRASPPEEGG
jgi:glutamyl-tRNA(Gln) amidotransferase subunit E